MNNKLISIIVPIFNCEGHIDRCLKSILGQTYTNIEVILIDDGSEDNSGQICDNYARIDNRIRVIHKKNEGVSTARNIGIENSNGVYIQFVDSDDYIEENMTEVLLEKLIMYETDLVVSGYNYIANQVSIPKYYKEITLNNLKEQSKEFLEIYSQYLFNSPWNKLYKREKIKILFDKKISLGEDLLFNLKYLEQCSKITIISECLYNYIEGNDNCLTKKYNANMFNIALIIYNTIINFCDKNLEEQYDKIFISQVLIDNIFIAIQGEIFNNETSYRLKIRTIREYVNNEIVKVALRYSKSKTLQGAVVKFLLKYKLINCICLFFYIKKLMLRILKDK